jgi:hypothetical protein
MVVFIQDHSGTERGYKAFAVQICFQSLKFTLRDVSQSTVAYVQFGLSDSVVLYIEVVLCDTQYYNYEYLRKYKGIF